MDDGILKVPQGDSHVQLRKRITGVLFCFVFLKKITSKSLGNLNTVIVK